MQRYAYKVVPAPEKSIKSKGVKAGAARFALTLEQVMNDLGADGWDYVRADTLPVQERSGLTSTQTVYRNVLVFRKPLDETAATPAPLAAPTSEPDPEVESGEALEITPETAPEILPDDSTIRDPDEAPEERSRA